MTSQGWGGAPTGAPGPPGRARSARDGNRTSLVVAGVVGLLLVLLVRSCTGGGGTGTTTQGGPAAGPGTDARGCTALAVTASSEKAALLRGLAEDYNADSPEVDGTCVRVTVSTKSSGGATEALARGWDETNDGPRPDVWTPASSSWVVLLRQRLAAQDEPSLVADGVQPSIARTPLVIAMPRPMAEAIGWPEAELGWSDLLELSRDPRGWGRYGHPEWGRFKLGKTNPFFSTSGLNATIGAYVAATGLSNDLTAKELASPQVRAYVQGLESSVVHYGDTTLTFLSNLQRADDAGQGLTYVSAVTVEEKSVWDYNQGNPTGDPATLGDRDEPRTPLVALYPKEGTLLSDNPWAVLDAEWVDDAKRAASADFLAHVQEKDSQRRFTAAAFRSADGTPGERIVPAEGLLPEQPAITLEPPAPAVLDAVQRSWTGLRKKARVLMVLDVSGSMGEPVPDAGTDKLTLAKDAARRALGGFAPEDEVGLWIFSTDLDGPKPYLPLVPIAPVSRNGPVLAERIAGLQAGGGTALYATTRAATAELRGSFDPDRINAVLLLTDGRNEYPVDTDLDGLLERLAGEAEDRGVRVFPVAYGQKADLPTLKRIAEASRAAAYDASNAATIDDVLTAVVSNF